MTSERLWRAGPAHPADEGEAFVEPLWRWPPIDHETLEAKMQECERQIAASSEAHQRTRFAFNMAKQAELQVSAWECETGRPAPEALRRKAAFWKARALEREERRYGNS